MTHTLRRFLEGAVFGSLMLVASDAWCQMSDLHPTSVEIAQLPTFCWSQMGVPNVSGSEFNFPSNCGPGMNHYCPGLVYLIRAKRFAYKAQRMSVLGQADGNIRYTEAAMKDYPNCSLREHVAAARAEVNTLRTLYGARRPAAK